MTEIDKLEKENKKLKQKVFYGVIFVVVTVIIILYNNLM